jgi:hypothetical protein
MLGWWPCSAVFWRIDAYLDFFFAARQKLAEARPGISAIVYRVSGASRFSGETFLQKTAFFLKELFGIPLSPKFRLYHYGPLTENVLAIPRRA